MLRELIRRGGHYLGVEIIRLNSSNFRWSHTVEDYHAVAPRVRWQAGQEPHDRLCRILDRNRADYEFFLDALMGNANLLEGIAFDEDDHSDAPFWNNQFFSALDAAALINFIALKRPVRYVEVGSGHSTRFARYAIRTLGLATKITSIDPAPRQDIDRICDRVIRTPLESCDLAIFDELGAGDILFVDGSHRAFSNSDVTVIFFEVLPRVKSGVMVHLHDIFIPDDYPAFWNHRLYNEQYILAAMLLCGNPPFRVVAPIAFIGRDESLGARAKRALVSRKGGSDIPFVYPNEANIPGVSFWIEVAPSAYLEDSRSLPLMSDTSLSASERPGSRL